MKTAGFLVLVFVGGMTTVVVAGQDALARVKAQYEGAAYEEALATISAVEPPTEADRSELEQYRAFCLLALGRVEEAQSVFMTLVERDPLYVPSTSVASPKVLSIVAAVRKKHLPHVARELLASGRAAFEARDFTAAEQKFDLLLKLLDDPAMETHDSREDLRAVAKAFVSLATVAVPPPSPAKADVGAPPAPPADATSAVPTPAVQNSDAIVPAVAVSQKLPEWRPAGPMTARTEYKGQLRLRIDTKGRVSAATVDDPTHPSYDERLLEAARDWLFKPATRNGVPIESEKTLAIVLRPQ